MLDSIRSRLNIIEEKKNKVGDITIDYPKWIKEEKEKNWRQHQATCVIELPKGESNVCIIDIYNIWKNNVWKFSRFDKKKNYTPTDSRSSTKLQTQGPWRKSVSFTIT
jgi:hypothetical protein